MKYLYEVLWLSKQGYYQRIKRGNKHAERNEKILSMVCEIRKKHHRSGTRKLMVYLREKLLLEGIKIGRDALNTLLGQNNLLVPKTKRFHITTDSNHYFYKSPNLLKETKITHSEQAVVCDITYLKVDDIHAYLALVTDPYSKKIMGFCVDDNTSASLSDRMRVELVKAALKMAHNNMIFKHEYVIHASTGSATVTATVAFSASTGSATILLP
jgi:transposase InsO family protein